MHWRHEVSNETIPFNRPYMTGKEFQYIAEAHLNGVLAGDGPFTKKCQCWLEERTGSRKALLTHSCTSALEMAAILADIHPGDEIIMPSYTFVSTANAFVLRGGVPVFVDIRPDTLNIDESRIEAAVTGKTRAIVAVHYAGIGCEMQRIMEIAGRRKLLVIEDAAQGIMASYQGSPLGSIGHFGTLSFHETKNIHCGEGGALLVNDEKYAERAEIIREKGTNRSQFFRGNVDKYTWCDIGSSFLPGELAAAFLWAQMEEAELITQKRMNIWNIYHQKFAELESKGLVVRPSVPQDAKHNAHMYYILVPSLKHRTALIERLSERGMNAVFHYVPLHSSPAGLRFGRASGNLSNTEELSDRLLRLPLWPELKPSQAEAVVDAVGEFLRR
jgi:dTDP-4-amino-4,6-dideoxygalactose transaminase